MHSLFYLGFVAAGASAAALPYGPPEGWTGSPGHGPPNGWTGPPGPGDDAQSSSISRISSTVTIVRPTGVTVSSQPTGVTTGGTVTPQTGENDETTDDNEKPVGNGSTGTGSGGGNACGDFSSHLAFIQSQDATYNSAFPNANIPVKEWSAELSKNACDTATANQGHNMEHQLGHGSAGQTISPGKNGSSGHDGFELAYLAWLCEVQDFGDLKANCDSYLSQAGIGLTAGEVGHHDILSKDGYSKIGCAWLKDEVEGGDGGLWVCDTA